MNIFEKLIQSKFSFETFLTKGIDPFFFFLFHPSLQRSGLNPGADSPFSLPIPDIIQAPDIALLIFLGGIYFRKVNQSTAPS
jgi:hypothetical protein